MQPTLTDQAVESSRMSSQAGNSIIIGEEATTATLNTSFDQTRLSQRVVLKQRKKESIPVTTTTASTTDTTSVNEDRYDRGGFFECNICFDTAAHPVLTLCGHLFCWKCLAQWLNLQSRNPTCPVCKAGSGNDKVIPVYGRGEEEADPRIDSSIPNRPAGQRPVPLHDPNRPATTSFFSPPFETSFNRESLRMPNFRIFSWSSNEAGNTQLSLQGAYLSRLGMMLFSLLVIAMIFS